MHVCFWNSARNENVRDNTARIPVRRSTYNTNENGVGKKKPREYGINTFDTSDESLLPTTVLVYSTYTFNFIYG